MFGGGLYLIVEIIQRLPKGYLMKDSWSEVLCECILILIFWTITSSILYEKDKQGEGKKQNIPKCQMACCLMPCVDRTVLILYTDICFKVTFDLNFNLQWLQKRNYLFSEA